MAAIQIVRPVRKVTALGYGSRVALALLLLTAAVAIAIESWPCDLTPIAGCVQ